MTRATHKSYKSMDRDIGSRSLAESVAEAVAGALSTCRDTDCIRIYRIIYEFVLSKANSHLFLPIPDLPNQHHSYTWCGFGKTEIRFSNFQVIENSRQASKLIAAHNLHMFLNGSGLYKFTFIFTHSQTHRILDTDLDTRYRIFFGTKR